ncbi:MAG: DUF1549 domain-containing protein, partial [Planctomycetaceae bacterium]|nr:DUF1549 domain-containing protein [Planctomycetaceae bacterium]
ETAQFLADPAEDAYEQLVQRMLDSPHYGERWARHWMDIVRFGESNGFEYDQPRDHAWHYRNWLIQALNQDMPYDEFVRMQLAGDVIRPDDYGGVSAVGFLVAGPHNTTLPSSQTMRMAMAQEELEDLVGSVGQIFLGLTVHCGRCHEHKFDPISQREYYQLVAALAGVKHGERTVKVTPTAAEQSRLEELAEQLRQARGQIEAWARPIRAEIIADRK